MKKFYILSCFLISCLTYAQETGQADWNYTQQTDLNNFANQEYQSISNSLVLTAPCDVDFPSLATNETFEVTCVYDLNGETITIPEGVTIAFFGGDIINGTLNFTSSGKIDGELLNYNLEVEGDATLTSETFNFDKNRWNIVEGEVSDEISLNNTDVLENLFLDIKELSANTFIIDDLDAYFKVDGFLNEGVPETHGINIPSDFNLSMSDDTHFRMQPNGHFRASLLSVYNENNITVTGGNLHGDREEHDYDSGFTDSDGSTGSTNEWVDTMRIKGGQNITIDGVTFMDATGDGLQISGINHYYESEHVKSTNILIKNCEFYRARRTNIVITSGDEITMENNQIIDGGIDMDNSTGAAPSSNFNIEAYRQYDEEGNIIEYQRVNNVYLRNNVQKVTDKEANPNAGDFQISHSNGPIIIDSNEMINTGVSFFTAEGVEITNNTFTEGGITAGSADNFGRTTVVYDNVISGNTIITSGTAFNVAGNGVTVTDNHFEGNIAVTFGAGAKTEEDGASNIEFTKNTIIGTSRGITTNNTMYNVLIDDNTIDIMDGGTFAAVLVNRWSEENTEEANFVFSNNTITGKKEGSESGAPPVQVFGNSATLNNNTIGELQFGSSSNIKVLENIIEAPTHQNGILINSEITNTMFDSNEVIIYTSKTPLSINCVKIADDVILPESTTFTNEICTEK